MTYWIELPNRPTHAPSLPPPPQAAVRGLAMSRPAGAAIGAVDPQWLRDIPMFSVLSGEALSRLARRSRVSTFAARRTLVVPEAMLDALHVVLAGRAHVLRGPTQGRAVLLEVLQAGDDFGLASLIDGQPPGAELRSRTAGRLLRIDGDALRAELYESPALLHGVTTAMVDRLRRSTRRIAVLALGDVRQRVVYQLRQSAECSPEGRLLLPARFSRTELAGSIGATREMVSRMLQVLLRDGTLTDLGDGTLQLADEAQRPSAVLRGVLDKQSRESPTCGGEFRTNIRYDCFHE